MNVPANVPFVVISQCPSTGFVVPCVSVRAVFHTSPPLLFFGQNCLISVSLSRLRCLHHRCASHPPPPKISGLSLHFMQNLYFVSVQQHRSISSANIFFWKRNLGKR